ncbi:zinc-binding protein A33 [Chanos chanos]|uniref:Zinc-binding protein A33 n=1 Tax=Chanos chanos TaxID=29144 RepID=A0A6J2W9S0_CHACN|nr:zinc-binding protein A33-like [Chanos chanos]
MSASADLRDELICPEHEERLRLFCETDQKLACVICRDGIKHRNHTFRPIKEAAQIYKGHLMEALSFLAKENRDLGDLATRQATATTETEDRSKVLSDQISAQFEEMYNFLKKRERELKEQLANEEKHLVNPMVRNHSSIENRWLDGREVEVLLQSALDIPEPDHFLKWWSEKGYSVTKRMKAGQTTYKSKVKDVKVIPHSLFLGPLETHLQFFVWKEMLSCIKPVPETLTIKDSGDSYLKVSPGGARVRQADRQTSQYKSYNPGVVTKDTFQRGQHYWDVEVGEKLDWSIGVTADTDPKKKDPKKQITLHLKHEKGYILSHEDKEIPITMNPLVKPRKIGLYLDCDRRRVSFYNADNMTLIQACNFSSIPPYSISLCPGLYLDGKNNDPLTVCWYGSARR